MTPRKPSRRQLLQMGAAVGGGLLAGREALALDADPRKLGEPLGPYGERSPFEKAVRWHRDSKTPETGSCFTPLQASVGTITPSSLHYERHHAGIQIALHAPQRDVPTCTGPTIQDGAGGRAQVSVRNVHNPARLLS